MEDLETSESKKAKLSDNAVAATPVSDETVEEEEQVGADTITGANAVQPTEGATSSEPKKGIDIHFKENPYTFLKPEDPVVKTCM